MIETSTDYRVNYEAIGHINDVENSGEGWTVRFIATDDYGTYVVFEREVPPEETVEVPF